MNSVCKAGLLLCVVLQLSVSAQNGLDLRINFGKPRPRVDLTSNTYLRTARNFMDAFLVQGRGADSVFAEYIDYATGEVRSNRFGNNLDVYRLAYSLSYFGGDPKYRRAADLSFARKLANGTGTMPAGEGSDGQAEHSGLPALQADMWRVNPDRLYRAAIGYWEYCIWDWDKGYYSRHCSGGGTGTGEHGEFPRHGVFYSIYWMEAFKHSLQKEFLRYINVLYDYFESVRLPSGALPMTYVSKDIPNHQFAQISIDSWTTMGYLPEAERQKITNFGLRSDDYMVNHAFPSNPTLGWELYKSSSALDGYVRYWQLLDFGTDRNVPMLKSKLLAVMDEYAQLAPEKIGWSGNLGHTILLMLYAYHFTGDTKYLDKAKQYADYAITHFFQNPLCLTCLSSFCGEGIINGSDRTNRFYTIGSSSANTGVSMLPLSLFLLGMEVSYPSYRVFYPGISR